MISDKRNEVKLSLPYDKLRYNSWEDPTDGDSCFMIEFDEADAPHLTSPKKSKKAPDEPTSTKPTLTVWTRQAGMIDTLASRYIDELDKWHDYLAMKARERGQAVLSRPDVHNRRVGLMHIHTLSDGVALIVLSLQWRAEQASQPHSASSLGPATAVQQMRGVCVSSSLNVHV